MQLALPAAVRAALLAHGIEPAGPLGVGAAGLRWSALGPDGRRYAVVHASGAVADAVRARAEVLARLDHPGLARCAHVLALPDGVVVLLEAEPGTDLAVLLEARGPLTPGEAVGVLAPVAEALAVLHEAGLAHGDVAPGNIVVGEAGPVLVDLLGGADVEEEGTDGFVAAGREDGPSAATDVAALGLVGEALLGTALAGAPRTGEPPTGTLPRSRRAVVPRDGAPVDAPGGSDELRLVLAVCASATGPVECRPSAAALAAALREACPAARMEPADPAVLARLGLRRFSGAALPVAVPVTRRVTRETRTSVGRRRPGRPRGPRSRWARWGVLAVAGVVGLGGTLVVLSAGAESPAQAAVRLSRERAAAMVAGDAVALAAVTVPESPAARADVAAMRTRSGAGDVGPTAPGEPRASASANRGAPEGRDWDLEVVAEGEVSCATSGTVLAMPSEVARQPDVSGTSGSRESGTVCVQVRTVTVYDGVAGLPRRVVLVLEPGPWRVAEVRGVP